MGLLFPADKKDQQSWTSGHPYHPQDLFLWGYLYVPHAVSVRCTAGTVRASGESAECALPGAWRIGALLCDLECGGKSAGSRTDQRIHLYGPGDHGHYLRAGAERTGYMDFGGGNDAGGGGAFSVGALLILLQKGDMRINL